HVDAAHEKPFVGDLEDRHVGRGGEIAGRRDVIGLPRVAPGDVKGGRYLARQIERHRQIGERLDVELDRVAYPERARGDRRGAGPAEGEGARGALHYRGALVPYPDGGGADLELAAAVGVRDPDSQGVAADADARIHPERMVVEADPGLAWRRRSGP